MCARLLFSTAKSISGNATKHLLGNLICRAFSNSLMSLKQHVHQNRETYYKNLTIGFEDNLLAQNNISKLIYETNANSSE